MAEPLKQPFPMVLACWFLLITLAVPSLLALEYPADPPGAATCSCGEGRWILANRVLRCAWEERNGRVGALTISDLVTGKSVFLAGGCMPRIVLSGGEVLDLAERIPAATLRTERTGADPSSPRGEDRHPGHRLCAAVADEASGLEIRWYAELRDGSNYVVQQIELRAERTLRIDELVFLDEALEGAHQAGEVAGSVAVLGNHFFAVEHPLALNEAVPPDRVRCALRQGGRLEAGGTRRFSAVAGVVPEGQLRRGFLYYLERRRAHPYRPFLHYNSWYHLNIARPDNHMTEKECLEAIGHVGRELAEKRGVKLDAFVWDDGWDDFDSLWGFHGDFPEGFAPLMESARRYGAALGVWMSPWGGYGGPHDRRVAFGRSRGYETNERGFSMAGPKYFAAFRDVCLEMMESNGVRFFKFDGMGGGTLAGGGRDELNDDVEAVLRLTRILRRADPDLFISATVGTWPSPFWTWYADSVWRQGGDTGFHGEGDTRRQWITYRDLYAFRRVVKRGPLYPLNAVMFHGLCIGERASPAGMSRDEGSVSDEIWTMFGCGMALQELYISPHLLTDAMWDELARAAGWSRANADVLVDSHWVGGDPGEGEVYGFASWQPRKGILVLRNPAGRAQPFRIRLRDAWELPAHVSGAYVLRRINASKAREGTREIEADAMVEETLQPFEVVVWEGEPGGG